MYILMCYMLTKSFHGKLMCRMTCVKKTKFDVKNKAFQMIIFFFVT
jgi:hypothetical protein